MARKQLNKNVVVALTLLGFGIIIAASAMMLRQLQQREPSYYTDLGRRYAEAGEFKTAAMFYRQAWERSQDPQHLVLHGDVLMEEGSVREALASWQVALINDPRLVDAHHRRLEVLLDFARLYRRLDSWQVAHEAADAFLTSGAELPAEEEAFARHANGLALVNLGRRDPGNEPAGEAELQLAVTLAPDNVAFALDLANYLAGAERFEESDGMFGELMDRYAAPGADAAQVRGAVAKHLTRRGEFERASEMFQAGLDLAGEDADALQRVRLDYASFLTQRWALAAQNATDAGEAALFDEAESILQQCVEADPESFDAYLNLAVLYQSAQRPADVLKACDQRLALGFSRKGVQADRHRVNAFSLMIYAADACVAEGVIAHRAGDQPTREGFLSRADQYLQDARGEFPDHPRLFTQSARVKIARGQERAALEDLRKADALYAGYDSVEWNNKLLLAQMHLSLGESGAARTVLEGALQAARRRRSSDMTFWTLYAQSLYATDELDRALAISDQILAADPGNVAALRVRAAVYERKGRGGEAARIVESLTGDEAVRPLQRAQQLSLEGKPGEAVTVLREALEAHPAHLTLVRAAVRELLNLERAEEARAIVEAARMVNPDDVTLKKLEVLSQTSHSSAQRDAALLEIINTQPDAYQRNLELMGFYWRREEYARVLPVIEQALQHRRDKDTPLAQQATIEQHRALLSAKLTLGAMLEDQTVANAARDEAIRYNVDGAHGQALLGQYHMQRLEYDLAIKALHQAIEAQPTDTRALTMLGQCLHSKGELDEAEKTYEQVIKIKPKEGAAYKGLAALAKQRDDTEAYEEALDEAARLIPLDAWVKAEVLARQEADDPAAAIALREEQLASDPNDAANLQRLAGLYETVGDLPEADKHWNALLSLRADDKNAVVMAGAYYRRTNRPERSLKVVTNFADTRTTTADRANAHILIASHYLPEDDMTVVEDALLKGADIEHTPEVVASLADFYRRRLNRADKALPWLEEAVALARASHSSRLPILLGARVSCLLDRRVGKLEDARAGVDELLTDFPNDLTGWLLKSEVHARSGEVDQAVDALTQYLSQKPDDAQALYQRALHRRARGKLSAAVEDLETLKRADPLALDLAPRLLLARLYRQSAGNAAWLRELESLAADASTEAAALEALARAYIQLSRFLEAERLVTGEINRSTADPDARWYSLRGAIAFETNQPRKALRDFQQGAQVAGHTAEAVAEVLEAFIRAGRFAEGIAYHNRFAPTAHPTPTMISNYARLLASAGDDAKAVAQFRRAMAMAIGEARAASLAVSGAIADAFDPARAIALFEADAPPGAWGRANDRILARLCRNTGRFDRAESFLQSLIDGASDDAERAELHAERGEALQTAGQNDRARQAYLEALKHNPDHWIVLNNLAYLLSDAMGEHSLARPYAERAAALVDSPATLDTLGWIYVGLSEYAPAVAELSRAIRLDPGDPLTYYHLGEAYRRNRQLRQAGDVLEDGLDLARNAGRSELIERFEASLTKVREGVDAP